MASLFHNIKTNLSENKEDWYNICQEAESALFRVKNECKSDIGVKTLERIILELNNIRMEQYEALTEYSLNEDAFEGKKITTNLHNDRTNPVWIIGDISIDNDTYIVNAKVFQEPSKFGIDKGPISKLYIAKESKYEEDTCVVNYDRGWDVKPTEETEEIYNITLGAVEAYRKDHPYETDPEEEPINESDQESTNIDLDKIVDLIKKQYIDNYKKDSLKYFNKELTTEFPDYWKIEEYPKDNYLVIDISWGDWKHDHSYCDDLVHQVADNLGLECIGGEDEPYEENGSDSYSATHSFEFSLKDSINESVDEDYTDPNYKVDIRGLNLTNGGYHNNSNAIYGRIKLSPKGDLESGVYDIIFLPEGEYLYVFKPGTDVRSAVDYLYRNDGMHDNEWVKWNGRRVQIKDFNTILEEDTNRIEPPIDQFNSIVSAIEEAYFNDNPISLNRVNYQ